MEFLLIFPFPKDELYYLTSFAQYPLFNVRVFYLLQIRISDEILYDILVLFFTESHFVQLKFHQHHRKVNFTSLLRWPLGILWFDFIHSLLAIVDILFFRLIMITGGNTIFWLVEVGPSLSYFHYLGYSGRMRCPWSYHSTNCLANNYI